MKFSYKELLNAGSHKWEESEIDLVTKRNLEDLILKVNALGFSLPRKASSCLRSIKDQQRINPKAMGSSHLYGCAVDVADPDGLLTKWVNSVEGQRKVVECGLWVENTKYTNGWVHFQVYSPKSGNRFFIP